MIGDKTVDSNMGQVARICRSLEGKNQMLGIFWSSNPEIGESINESRPIVLWD